MSGAKALYVREGECVGIEGMPDAEAAALIARLSGHIVRPEFRYRRRWRVGDLVIRDNCVAPHVALRDYEWPQRRLMHRVTAGGSVPFRARGRRGGFALQGRPETRGSGSRRRRA